MPIDFIDLEATEPDYYKSLKMMLDNPLDLLGFSGMTFTAEIQKFGRTEVNEFLQFYHERLTVFIACRTSI
jgi:hypothetical protein